MVRPPPLESLPNDQALLSVLEAIGAVGIVNLGTLLTGLLRSGHPGIQRHIDIFLRESFVGIVTQLMDKSYYGPTRRRTARQTETTSTAIGERLIDWVTKILAQEIKETAADPRAKLSPSKLRPHHALDFSFRDVENLFAMRAPLTFRLMTNLCSVRQGENAGQRSYLGNISRDSDALGSAEEFLDVEDAWDEGDPWQDDTASQPIPAARDSCGRKQLRRKSMKSSSGNDHGSMDNSGDRPDTEQQKRRRPRRVRNKALVASTVLAQILYAHNQSANAFQTIMAAYCFASQTGKRVIAVLNQLGLCVSPTTFANALKHNSAAASAAIKEGIQSGRKIGLFYDNLVIYDKKAEESETNKNRSLQLTACGGYFLQLPLESAEYINSRGDPTLAGVQDAQVEMIGNSPRAGGSSNSDFDPLDSPPANNGAAYCATGIKSELLLQPNPDYSSIRTLDILCTGSHKYFEETVKGHLCILLRKHFNQAILKNRRKGLLEKEYKLKTLFQVPVVKSDVFALPTLDLDESTIDGNAAILETLAGTLGFGLDKLQETIIPVSGDQMTLSRIRGVQELRVRDRPEHRALFAEPWMGFLHFGFATADTIKRCNSGTPGGGDPGSLSTYVQLLGRTGILDSKPNFNATHRLVEEIGEATSLAAFLEIACVKTMAELEAKIAMEDWVEYVDQVYEEYFPLNKVGLLRARAIQTATTVYEQRLEEARAVRPARRTSDQVDFLSLSKAAYIQAESDKLRDLAYENSLLLMQQIMLHHDFYCAMRKGDSGRLEKSLEMFLLLFEGAGKNNYAQELLEQQIDRRVIWTPYMRALWQRNCLLNISGSPNKFLAVDEVCEYLVRQLKSSYNPKNTWQSKQFHMETMSRLTMLFRDIRRVVTASSGAPSFGTRHSKVDSSRDVALLVKYITDEELLYHHREGRSRISNLHNARRIVESIDAWSAGKASYSTGVPLTRAIDKRLERQVAGMKVSFAATSPWTYNLDGQGLCMWEEDLVEGAIGEEEVEFNMSDTSSDTSSDTDV